MSVPGLCHEGPPTRSQDRAPARTCDLTAASVNRRAPALRGIDPPPHKQRHERRRLSSPPPVAAALAQVPLPPPLAFPRRAEYRPESSSPDRWWNLWREPGGPHAPLHRSAGTEKDLAPDPG